MALEIFRTPAAERDVIEIWDYIADDSERAADRCSTASTGFSECSPITHSRVALAPS